MMQQDNQDRQIINKNIPGADGNDDDGMKDTPHPPPARIICRQQESDEQTYLAAAGTSPLDRLDLPC
jgi:hypothetical protein